MPFLCQLLGWRRGAKFDPLIRRRGVLVKTRRLGAAVFEDGGNGSIDCTKTHKDC